MDTTILRIAILIVLLSNKAIADEPKCYSRFDYDEKMIEKMIRAEIKLEEFAKRMDLNDATVGDIKTDVRNKIQTAKEDVSMDLNDFIQKYVANSTGQLEKIAFYASLSDDISKTTASAPLVFNNVITNIGGGYEPSTGLFTAPTNGLFVFSLTVRQYGYPSYGFEGHFSIKK
ncbi:hypothetical protein MAR_036310 [Mya arenaria]|uniref:C1q domain-containing protein n=1 Tax=Mya arenaria TaxID=6604 RepID=A0ABY7EQ30_MYAAR|nr:hypothetical protein MAR_036310 [Mya arenaria]